MPSHQRSAPSSATVVQATNDTSLVSKCSAQNLGYFKKGHRWLGAFKKGPRSKKGARRAPLINRGYYARVQCIERAVRNFAALPLGQPRQILCLGAGFDTMFFALAEDGLVPDGGYFELDYHPVIIQKAAVIQKDADMRSLLGEVKVFSPNPDEETSAGLRLVAGDLNHLNRLKDTLSAAGCRWDRPTLVVSECVLAYLPVANADAVISWTASAFDNAGFLMYEPIVPHDAFGSQMVRHFAKNGTTLDAIQEYPSVKKQQERFAQLGWASVKSLPMDQILEIELTPEEGARIDALEPFDEDEEYSLKCNHYAIVTASTGSTMSVGADGLFSLQSRWPLGAKPEEFKASGSHPSSRDGGSRLAAALKDAHGSGGGGPSEDSNANTAEDRRWSHAAAIVENSAYIFGGFGGNKNARLAKLLRLDLATMVWHDHQSAGSSQPEPAARMSPAMCSTLRSTLLLFGGRAGPMRPKNDCHEYDPMSGEWQELSQTGAVPSARWRHTLTRLRSGRIVLVGGRDSCGVCLESSCAEVHLAEAVGDSRCPASAAWTSLEATGSVPGPRYAHCAATANDGDTLVISGGIGPNRLHATPLHVLKDLATNQWCYIEAGDKEELCLAFQRYIGRP
eukprot:gene13567-28620_t